MDLFEKQGKAYRDKVLGTEKVRIGIEAALRNNWDRFIGLDGIFIGMTGFGASGPAEKLYPHFGITAKAVLQAVKKKKR
jgi:transketolase